MPSGFAPNHRTHQITGAATTMATFFDSCFQVARHRGRKTKLLPMYSWAIIHTSAPPWDRLNWRVSRVCSTPPMLPGSTQGQRPRT